jgi:hypothetical protein
MIGSDPQTMMVEQLARQLISGLLIGLQVVGSPHPDDGGMPAAATIEDDLRLAGHPWRRG